MEFSTFLGAAIVLDAFFEAGGNLVDSAFHYGGGMQDRLIGEWMQSRGVREQTVVIEKGRSYARSAIPMSSPSSLPSVWNG